VLVTNGTFAYFIPNLMEFFKFTGTDIELAKNEIALYPEALKILRRVVACTGDADGRKKLYNFKEFKYVYFTCDHRAYPYQHGLSVADTHDYALKQSELPNDYKPDVDMVALMNLYKEEHWSVTKKTTFNILRALGMSNDVIDRIQKSIDANLLINETFDTATVDAMIKFQKQLIELAIAIPKQIEEAKKMLAKLDEEDGKATEKLRGKAEIEDSMNPDNDIDKGLIEDEGVVY